MVSVEQINDYFTKKYKRIDEITNTYISKYTPKIEKEVIINESYLHIYKLKNEIEENQIEAYILTFIKNHIIWNDNPITRVERIREREEITDKIEYEENENINEPKYLAIDQVYENEIDQIKKIVHDVYFNKNKRTARQMAEHFGISKFSSHELITQLKQDINEYFKTKIRVHE